MLLPIAALVLAQATANAPLAHRIDDRVREYVGAGLFSGVVLVARGDDVVYQGAFGLADRSFKVSNTVDTKFHIASVSKPITAAAVLLLAERGKLSLDDHVSKFVPDFPNGDRITLEEVLTHYSGLDNASDLPDYDNWSRFPQTPSSLVEKLAKLPLSSEPGTTYSYSASNYHLLAFIIEKVSGMSYGDFLAQNIFAPLGMSNTAHHASDEAVIAGLANGYMAKDADGFEKPAYFDWTSKTGNGSLYTTAADLYKFHRALQHGGLLKAETVASSYGFDPEKRDVGMFWYRRNENGRRSVYMGGSTPGFKAHFERFIDDDVAIIVLSNVYIASPSQIARDIRTMLWSDKKLDAVPTPVKRSADELRRVAGSYQFGPDFYERNLLARVEARDGFLVLHYPTFELPLTPIANGQYFDRRFWSFVRFEDGKMIYSNAGDDHVGIKQ